MKNAGVDIEKFCTKRGLNSLHDVQQQKFDETCKSLNEMIKRNAEAQQANEEQLQQEQDALLEQDYQQALAVIQKAQSAVELQYPADFFKGTKYEQQILNSCQAKSDMEGWTA